MVIGYVLLRGAVDWPLGVTANGIHVRSFVSGDEVFASHGKKV